MAIPVSMYQEYVAAQDKTIVASSTDNFSLPSTAQIAMTTIQQQQNDLDQQQVNLQGSYQTDSLDTATITEQTISLDPQNIVTVQPDGLDTQSLTVQGIPLEAKSEPEWLCKT